MRLILSRIIMLSVPIDKNWTLGKILCKGHRLISINERFDDTNLVSSKSSALMRKPQSSMIIGYAKNTTKLGRPVQYYIIDFLKQILLSQPTKGIFHLPTK